MSRIKEAKAPIIKPRQKKYIVSWSLVLTDDELEKISMHPEVLQKGLSYVKTTAKHNKIEIYRIAEMEETTSFSRPIGMRKSTFTKPHGIAILEATSIEEARMMVDQWVEGFGFGGISVQNYLEYEIKPLVNVSTGGKL